MTNTISSRLSKLLFGATVAWSMSACGTSTKFWSDWSEHNAQPVSVTSHRVATVFFNSNESVRRQSEDVIANEVARFGGVAIPSYTIIPDNPQDRERAKLALQKAGIEAVIAMRVVSKERIVEGFSGPAYGSLWGYWGYGWGSAFDPGYLNTELVVGVETMLYSIKDDKLLWAGMSETYSPRNVENAVKSIARKAVEKMDESAVLTTR